MNLPTKITFANNNYITYLYNAVGQKVNKVVSELVLYQNITTTDYLSGFQYVNNNLQFFPHAEGYVKVTGTSYDYVYNYTDHLGNIRLSYSKDTNTNALKVIEENHYYPFGLKHTGYNSDRFVFVPILENTGRKFNTIIRPFRPDTVVLDYNSLSLNYDYKYNGKEYQDELGLNMYDYGARNYDAAIGRWMNIDPLAELGRRWSPYVYAMNSPVFLIDPDGMLSQSFIDKLWNKSGEGVTKWTNNNGTFANNIGDTVDATENNEDGEKEKDKTTNSKTADGARVKRKGTGENINYFDPNDKVHKGLYLTAENQNIENGVLKLFLHGSNQSINGMQYSENLDDFLYRDSEVWRNFVDNGGKLTVILYGCLTAEDIKDGSRNPIAKDFAIYNYNKGRNLELIAATSNISGDYDRKRFFVHNGGHWVKYVKEIVNKSTTKKQ